MGDRDRERESNRERQRYRDGEWGQERKDGVGRAEVCRDAEKQT